MSLAAFWFVNTVSVTPLTGEGAYGPVYGAPLDVACWVEDESKLVRNTQGDEVVSSARVFCALSDAVSFPVGSRVTLPSGRVSTVMMLNTLDSGSLNLGLDHAVVQLV